MGLLGDVLLFPVNVVRHIPIVKEVVKVVEAKHHVDLSNKQAKNAGKAIAVIAAAIGPLAAPVAALWYDEIQNKNKGKGVHLKITTLAFQVVKVKITSR